MTSGAFHDCLEEFGRDYPSAVGAGVWVVTSQPLSNAIRMEDVTALQLDDELTLPHTMQVDGTVLVQVFLEFSGWVMSVNDIVVNTILKFFSHCCSL